MNKLHTILKYLQHLISAQSPTNIRNPFVEEAVTNILKDDHQFYMFSVIESLRSQMLLSSESIYVDDLGTGLSGERKIKSIAANSLKNAQQAQLLFRLVNHLQPKTILELGTSLGITTLYLSKVNENTQVLTLEGSTEIAEIAEANFKKLKASNVQVVRGNIDNTLTEVLAKLSPLDFCFMDGNHREAPTLRYFNMVAEKSSDHAIIVLDDIHWSAEMSSAWQQIQMHSKVSVSIDLYHMGIVFLNPTLQKENCTIRI